MITWFEYGKFFRKCFSQTGKEDAAFFHVTIAGAAFFPIAFVHILTDTSVYRPVFLWQIIIFLIICIKMLHLTFFNRYEKFGLLSADFELTGRTLQRKFRCGSKRCIHYGPDQIIIRTAVLKDIKIQQRKKAFRYFMENEKRSQPEKIQNILIIVKIEQLQAFFIMAGQPIPVYMDEFPSAHHIPAAQSHKLLPVFLTSFFQTKGRLVWFQDSVEIYRMMIVQIRFHLMKTGEMPEIGKVKTIPVKGKDISFPL